jgi:hypothetical protein
MGSGTSSVCPPDHFTVATRSTRTCTSQVHPDLDGPGPVRRSRASSLGRGSDRRASRSGSGPAGPRVHRQRRHRRRREVRPEPVPPPGAPGRDSDRRRMVRFQGIRDRRARATSPSRAPATRSRSGSISRLRERSSHRSSVAGYRTRSSVLTFGAERRCSGVPVRSVELVDDRYYHVDLVFCPVDSRRALVAPAGSRPLRGPGDRAAGTRARLARRRRGRGFLRQLRGGRWWSSSCPRARPASGAARGVRPRGRGDAGGRVLEGRRRLPVSHPRARRPVRARPRRLSVTSTAEHALARRASASARIGHGHRNRQSDNR